MTDKEKDKIKQKSIERNPDHKSADDQENAFIGSTLA
jgi:hypothetical protein